PAGVELAAARAITEPGRAAAGRPLIAADARRIRAAGRHRRAGADAAGERARQARPGAGGGAADAPRADPAPRVGPLLADRARGLEAARAVRAAVLARGAVAVAGAGRFAGVHATDERKAGAGRRRLTAAHAVAGPAGREGAARHRAAR